MAKLKPIAADIVANPQEYITKSYKVGHNREMWVSSFGNVNFFLRDKNIATFYPRSGRVCVEIGEHNTITTIKAMNEFLDLVGAEYRALYTKGSSI